MERHICEPIRDIEMVKEMMEALRMRRNGFRDAMLFELGLSTALRINDLLQLRKKDVQNGILRVKTKKTGQYRNFALNEAIRMKIEAYIAGIKDDELLFPFQRQWVHKMLKWAADQVGLDTRYVSTHVMRKTAAYHFYIRTKDIVKTQQFLGHQSPNETRKYIMLNDEDVNEELVNILWS